MAVLSNMIDRGHEQVVYFNDPKVGLKAIVAIHDTTLGPSLGGCRMWDYKNEEEALIDVLRLSKGMTYKAAIAGLKLGGGKSVIIGNSKTDKSEDLFESFGNFVENLNGKYITAEDVGTTERDMEIVRTKTEYVTGLSKQNGGGGDPSPVTAYGTYIGIKASASYRLNVSSLSGLKIIVQGIGSVGEALISYLCNDGADVYINDIDLEKLNDVSKKYNVKIVGLNDLYDFNADIYAPCALGATVNDLTINKFKCSIIAGAANNVLLNPEKHGLELKNRGILFAPDYVINAGGLINVANEIEGYDEVKVKNDTEKIYDTLLNIYNISEEKDISTSKASSQLAMQIIAEKNESKFLEFNYDK